jgi:hypothetical protein
MIRGIAALILVLALNPALLHAQDTALTISVPSADVYDGPSNVTPVIGHVSRGTVLPISRNLGSWVKVAWPDARDGVGYVHVTMGLIGPPNPHAAANVPPRATTASASATLATPRQICTSFGECVVPSSEPDRTPASHMIGIGGLVQWTPAFGATVRAWSHNHVGFQFGFTRQAMTSASAVGSVTSTQFEPGVVYALFDHVSDYVWFRPYVGSAASFRHQTLNVAAPVVLELASDNGIGLRVFGGSELMFASMPRFGLSADIGYRHVPTAFAGFEASPISVSVAGHWYVR